MIKLHSLPALDRAPSLSPFCMKVELYLRMTGVLYEPIIELDASPGPKGKLPYIELEDLRLGDSYFIIEYLKRIHGDPLDAELGARDRAIGLAVSRMLDEHLYWALVHSRWLDPRFSPRMLDVFLSAVPAEQRAPIETAVIDGLAKTLRAHGIGRHSPDEVQARAAADLTAVATLLGTSDFMLGDRPTSLDAAVYPFVSNLVDVDMDTELRRHAFSHANLVAYAARMRARYYS